MNIVVVEDEYLAAKDLTDELLVAFPESRIIVVPTESDFCTHLDRLTAHPPTAIIMDMMIRWADTTDGGGPKVPEDVSAAGPWRAGKRCLERLRQRGIQSPVALYSVLDEEDLREDRLEGVRLFPKAPDLSAIISWIRNLPSARPDSEARIT